MTNKLPFDELLLKAAPHLKQAILPQKKILTHHQALLSCFETLCHLEKSDLVPKVDPFATSIPEFIEGLATSCQYRAREVNLLHIDLLKESGPLIVFDKKTSMPNLLFYHQAEAYFYDPIHHESDLLTADKILEFDVMGFALYPCLKKETSSFFSLVKQAYHQTHRELKRFLLLQGILGGFTLLQPILTSIIFDDVISLGQYSILHSIVLALFLSLTMTTILSAIQNYAVMRFRCKSDRFMQAGLWDKVLAFHSHFFRMFRLGDLHERITSVDRIQNEITTASISSLTQIIFAIINLGLIFFYLPSFGGIVLVLSFVFLIPTLFIVRIIVGYQRSMMALDARLISFLYEALRSVVKIKTTLSQHKTIARWLNFELNKLSHFMKSQYLSIYLHIFQFVLPLLGTLFLYSYAIGQMPSLTAPMSASSLPLSLGMFMALQVAMGQYFSSLTGMIGVISQMLHLVPIVERAKPVLKEPSEQSATPKVPLMIQGKVSLNNVSFSYNAGENLTLKNLQHTFEKGKWSAIVGPSGAGKSTLFRLILGFDKCLDGTILFDDLPMDQIDIYALRRQMGVVLQYTTLIPGSIFENLLHVNANLTEEDIWNLLDHVALKKDIQSMPMGLHTLVTGDGRTFSMGQRQRLALARCLAKPTAITLLDEATSALDNKSQDIVLSTIRSLPSTRLMVAHRLSTIRYADSILVMDKGKIVECGQFNELLKAKGLFYQMAEKQSI